MIILCILIVAVSAQRRPIVTLPAGGQLQGTREISSLSRPYLAFKGIPYANAPVGDLRFRNPVPHEGWSGVRDASRHGNHCPNDGVGGFGAGGDEDCLFLNVYAPNLNGNLSVMFWLHGGAFVLGDGNSFLYGPDFLLEENVIVITINYRLASLGFLSTGDKHAQGNYGLKDIVMALKWMQTNIAAFGGNPNTVTVFGQSAGASAIHFLLISPMSTGLFHQAIMLSGSALQSFTYQRHVREKADALGHKLRLKFNSTKSLVQELKEVPFKNFRGVENGFAGMDKPLALRPFDFVPSIEPEDSLEERFLTDDPTKLMMQGNYIQVPMIIGTTSNEGLMMLRENVIGNTALTDYNKNNFYFVPMSFHLTENSPEAHEVADTFRSFYFNNQSLSRDNLNEFALFHTDAQFKFPNDRMIKYFARNSTQPTPPIYSYEFSYSGALNLLKTLYFLKSYDGVCHADDLFYLFSTSLPIPVGPSDHALTVRRRMIRLFTNFAKYGNPTSQTDELIDKIWPLYTLENERYFEIGHDLKVQEGQPRLKMWHDFQQRFTGHL